jgi:Spy/CpxP family protein refolding chaperone
MNKQWAIVLFVVASLVAHAAWAQDKLADVTDMDALRAAVKSDKRAFVASTLKLTDIQAKRFWPIYDAYQRSLDRTNRRRVVAIEGLIGRDRPLTDLYARSLANDLISSDEAEVKARRTLHNRVMRALPPLKAVRYMQLESKIRAVQAYDLASTLPLVQ